MEKNGKYIVWPNSTTGRKNVAWSTLSIFLSFNAFNNLFISNRIVSFKDNVLEAIKVTNTDIESILQGNHIIWYDHDINHEIVPFRPTNRIANALAKN